MPVYLTSDCHVAEEEPASYETFLGVARSLLHNVKVRWIEAEGGGGQAVGDEVHPQQLYRDQSLRHAESGRQEDTAVRRT